MALIQTPIGATSSNPYTAIPDTGGSQQGSIQPQQASGLINTVGTKVGENLFGGSGVTGTINNVGANAGITGLPQGAPLINGVGPTNVAQSGVLGTTTASNILGGAGVGGLVANLTGGNSIAGSVGGAAGMVLGNALLPGVGGWLGSAVLGGIGGKLFGKSKPSNKLQVASVALNDGGFNAEADNKVSQTGKKFDATNRSVADTLRNATSATSQFLLKNGGKVDPTKDSRVLWGVGSRDGMWYATGTGSGHSGWEQNQVKVADTGQLSNGVFDTLIKQYGITDPKLIEQAKYVFAQSGGSQLASNSGGSQLSAAIPEVKNKKDTGKQTFAQFVMDYKTKTGATGGPVPDVQKKVVA